MGLYDQTDNGVKVGKVKLLSRATTYSVRPTASEIAGSLVEG